MAVHVCVRNILVLAFSPHCKLFRLRTYLLFHLLSEFLFDLIYKLGSYHSTDTALPKVTKDLNSEHSSLYAVLVQSNLSRVCELGSLPFFPSLIPTSLNQIIDLPWDKLPLLSLLLQHLHILALACPCLTSHCHFPLLDFDPPGSSLGMFLSSPNSITVVPIQMDSNLITTLAKF